MSKIEFCVLLVYFISFLVFFFLCFVSNVYIHLTMGVHIVTRKYSTYHNFFFCLKITLISHYFECDQTQLKNTLQKLVFLWCHLSNVSKLCKYKLAGTVAVNFGFENFARINCKAFATVINQIYGNTDKKVQAQCYFFVLYYFKNFCITIVEGIRKRTTLVFVWNGHYCLGIIAFACFFFSSFIEYILTSSSCLSVLCVGGVLFKSARVSYTLRSRVYLVPVTLHLP